MPGVCPPVGQLDDGVPQRDRLRRIVDRFQSHPERWTCGLAGTLGFAFDGFDVRHAHGQAGPEVRGLTERHRRRRHRGSHGHRIERARGESAVAAEGWPSLPRLRCRSRPARVGRPVANAPASAYLTAAALPPTGRPADPPTLAGHPVPRGQWRRSSVISSRDSVETEAACRVPAASGADGGTVDLRRASGSDQGPVRCWRHPGGRRRLKDAQRARRSACQFRAIADRSSPKNRVRAVSRGARHPRTSRCSELSPWFPS